jgi:hypothetical protein
MNNSRGNSYEKGKHLNSEEIVYADYLIIIFYEREK